MILILGILLISVFWKYKNLVIFGFCILFLVLGIWRHQTFLSKIENSQIKNFIGKEVTLTGLIGSEPEIREKSTKLTVEVGKIETEGGSPLIEGKVLVTTWKYLEYRYGDKVKITGKLEEPQVFDPKLPKATGSPTTESGIGEGFNYKNYLLKDGILSVMYFPEIELVGGGFGNPIIKFLFSFKNKLKESLNNLMSLPQSALLEALFFGDEENISQSWKEKFNLTGTRHITAVSGMNIKISLWLLTELLVLLN